MTAPALAAAAVALLAVPGRVRAVVRLRSLLPPSGRRSPPGRGRRGRRWHLPQVGTRGSAWLCAGAGLAAGTALGGPVVGVAGAVASAALSLLVHHASSNRAHGRELDRVTEALAALTAELRAGRTPADALRTAAAVVGGRGLADPDPDPDPDPDLATATAADDGPVRPGGGGGGVARALIVAAATAAVGGDVPAALRHTAGAGPPDTGALLGRVAAAWQVSACSGASLAAVLALVERDARVRAGQRRRLAAELAGPRATAALLAALPCVGLMLGTALGARPVDTLLHTTAGQFSLLVGVLLDVAGAAWTLRLVGTGARP